MIFLMRVRKAAIEESCFLLLDKGKRFGVHSVILKNRHVTENIVPERRLTGYVSFFLFFAILGFCGEGKFVIDPLDNHHGWNTTVSGRGRDATVVKVSPGITTPVLKMGYRFMESGDRSGFCGYHKTITIPEGSKYLHFQLKGDGSANVLEIQCYDANREMYHYFPCTLEEKRWREVSVELFRPAMVTGGDFDRVRQHPFAFHFLLLRQKATGSSLSGSFLLDEFSVTARFPESETLRITATSGKIGNIFLTGERIRFEIAMQNLVKKNRRVSLRGFITDIDRRLLHDGQRSFYLSPVERKLAFWEVPVDKTGCFFLNLEIRTPGGNLKSVKRIPFSRVYPPLEKREHDIFGICTHFGQNKGSPEYNLPLAALAGFSWIRDEMYWKDAERVKGEIRILPGWEKYVNLALENDLKVFLTLSYGNRFYDEGGPPYTKEGIDAFARYAETLARSFSGRVSDFEVWNEYNLGKGKDHPPGDYALLLKGTENALKGVDSGIRVTGGSVGGFAPDWISGLFEEGCLDHMDIFSIIPHVYPGSPEYRDLFGMIEKVEDLMKSHGERKPIWISEIGWPTHQWSNGVTEKLSGAYLVRLYIQALARGTPSRIFWYNLQNDDTSRERNEANFGLVRSWSNEEAPWSAKANFAAMNHLTHRLHGKRFERHVFPGEDFYAFMFREKEDPGEKLLVLWKDGGARQIGIDAGTESISQFDLMGNPTRLFSSKRIHPVILSDYPLFLEGRFGKLRIETPPVKILDPDISVPSGDILTVSLRHSFELPLKADCGIPMGWEQLDRVTTDTGSGVTTSLLIRTPLESELETFEIPIDLKGGDDLKSRVSVFCHTTPCFSWRMRPELIRKGEERSWGVHLSFQNRSRTNTFTGMLVPLFPSSWKESAPSHSFRDLDPGDRRGFVFPVPGVKDGGELALGLNLRLPHGFEQEIEDTIHFLAAVRTDSPVRIDGNTKDWEKAIPFMLDHPSQLEDVYGWKGPSDLSCRGRLQWDDDNLYLLVEVLDDEYIQENEGGDIWKGDGIQFALDFERENDDITKGHHEIGLALKGSEIIKWRWLSAYGKPVGEFRGAHVIIGKAEGRMIYEASVPWRDLLPPGRKPEPNEIFGFCLIVNDVDSDGRGRGWIEYTGGVGRTKDPNLFSEIILAP